MNSPSLRLLQHTMIKANSDTEGIHAVALALQGSQLQSTLLPHLDKPNYGFAQEPQGDNGDSFTAANNKVMAASMDAIGATNYSTSADLTISVALNHINHLDQDPSSNTKCATSILNNDSSITDLASVNANDPDSVTKFNLNNSAATNLDKPTRLPNKGDITHWQQLSDSPLLPRSQSGDCRGGIHLQRDQGKKGSALQSTQGDSMDFSWDSHADMQMEVANVTHTNDIATEDDEFDYDAAYDAMVGFESPTKPADVEKKVVDLRSDGDDTDSDDVIVVDDEDKNGTCSPIPRQHFNLRSLFSSSILQIFTVLVPVAKLLGPNETIYELPQNQQLRVSHSLYAKAISFQPIVPEYPMAGPVTNQEPKMRVGGTVHIIDNTVFTNVNPGAIFGMVRSLPCFIAFKLHFSGILILSLFLVFTPQMQYSVKTTGSPPIKQQPLYVFDALDASLPGIRDHQVPLFSKTSFTCRGVFVCDELDPSIRDYHHYGFATYPDFDAEPFASVRERLRLAECIRTHRKTIEFYVKHVVNFKCKCSPDSAPILRHNVLSIFTSFLTCILSLTPFFPHSCLLSSQTPNHRA